MQQTVKLFGSGTKGKSSNVTAQRRINLYAELPRDADKSDTVLYGRPGLRAVSTRPVSYSEASFSGGPFRGITASVGFGVQGVVGQSYVSGGGNDPASGTGWQVSLPTFRTSSGFVSMANFVAVDGESLYVYQYDQQTYGHVNIPYGVTSVCYIASRYVVCGGDVYGRFYWSPLNWTYPDVDWDALDYATAESSSDGLIGCFESSGTLVLMGARSTEFWAPDPSESIFSRVGGAGIGWGLASLPSVVKYNEGLIFLGHNELGGLQVAMLRGYQATVISTPDIESVIAQDVAPASATGWSCTIAGHSFYGLNLANTTLVYNITTGEWGEWQTAGGRFCGQFAVSGNTGGVFFTDYRDGRFWEAVDELQYDGTEPVVREVITRHLTTAQRIVSVWQLRLDAEFGTGISTGQGSDPQVMLQVSKDGGHTFGPELWQPLGKMGEYLTQVVWNRLGPGRDFVFRIRISDPVKVVLLGAAIDLA